MELLTRFFEGQLVSPDATQLASLDLHELYKPGESKTKLPPLLRKLSETIPPQLNYLGVSFGLTKEVYRFWQKNGFEPAYLSLKKNDVTGECSCIVVRPLSQEGDNDV
jgi:N-acetyltransferase 10